MTYFVFIGLVFAILLLTSYTWAEKFEEMLSLIKACTNINNLIVNEFTKEELGKLSNMFNKVYTKKSYSLYNPHNLFNQDCQWYNDRAYKSYGWGKDITIVKGDEFGSLKGGQLWIKWYDVRYDRCGDLSYLPRQYGLASTSKTWNTWEELEGLKKEYEL